MLTRDTTYLDAPETDVCYHCDDCHAADEPEDCSCHCHWDTEDEEIERLRQREEDV